MALTDKLTAIADAIRARTGSTEQMTLDQMPLEIAGIEGGGGMDDAEVVFEQQNAVVTEFLCESDMTYTNENYDSLSAISKYTAEGVVNDDPEGYELNIAEAGKLYFTDESDTRYSWEEDVIVGKYTVCDLIPEHTYRWYLVNASGKTVQAGKLRATGRVRMIGDASINTSGYGSNIRDFGGWNGDGGRVRYGILYRGAVPYEISEATKAKMKDNLRIRSQIDLYSVQAHRLYGDILYHPFPLTDTSTVANVELGGELCAAAAGALALAMDNASKGVGTYIHCWAGSDRTGFLSWLLHILLGVSEADSDKDYELTGFSGRGGRQRNNAYWYNFVNYMDSFGKATLMENVLYWCARVGISAKLINAYRKAMIKGTPSNISFNNTVTGTFTNITGSNSSLEVENGASYTNVLTLADGALLMSLKVTMNGEDITNSAWDESTGTVSIDEVLGDICIIASASLDAVSIVYDLTDISSTNNISSVIRGESYNTVLIAADGYDIGNVSVTMGGVDITDTAYHPDICTVLIENITASVVIRASRKGYVNLIASIGYTDGQRLSTSTGVLKSESGYVTTGFIDMSSGDVIRTRGVDFRASTHPNCAFVWYKADERFNSSNYLTEIDHSQYSVAFDELGNLAFTSKAINLKLRLCGYGFGADLILTKNEEITD